MPGYLSLYRSGELKRRADALEKRLGSCDLCPRNCHANRLKGELGFCHSGYLPIVASFCAHHGEEPAISGKHGSGTIFFANCNMACIYCQNYQISQDPQNQWVNEIDCETLAQRMLYLQDELGCHNINLVTPTHFVPQIVRAVLLAVPKGLTLPLVYNSSGYESLTTLKELSGIIDIYLPDLRYASDEYSVRYSQAPGYVARSREAIKEMFRQVGELKLDEAGVAQRGLVVRHLILPGGISGSQDSLTWLAEEVSPGVTVSIMSQYSPQHRAGQFPELARGITPEEYRAVVRLAHKLGLEEGWLQGMEAKEEYLPDFNLKGHPFARRMDKV